MNDRVNVSPEEILRQKELDGGLVYDDPQDLIQPNPVQQEIPPAEKPVERIPDPVMPRIPQQNQQEEAPTSLGKAQSFGAPLAGDNGWKNLPVSVLPSQGMFYPEGTKMAIRAAEVKEIRHFSTIDEDDRLDIEEKLSYVLDRCLRIDFPGEGVVSYKDLKQEDRFFLIMAIRDLTFVKGENSIMLKPKKTCKETTECPFTNGIELRTGALSSYSLEDKILQYYNSSTRSFVFTIKKTGKSIEMFIPSIGVSQQITSYIAEAARKGIGIDDGSYKYLLFFLMTGDL